MRSPKLPAAMHRYRRLRLVLVVVLAAEFVVGLGGALAPRAEIFPFASWFLFSLVPARTSEFDLVFQSVGEQPLDPPLRLSQSARYVRTPHSIVTYQLIQQLGRALQARDDARATTLRRQIESQFTAPGLRYDLVRITYRPVERWESGRVESSQPLRSFTAWEY